MLASTFHELKDPVSSQESTRAQSGQRERNWGEEERGRDGGAASAPLGSISAPSLCSGSVWVSIQTQVKFRYFYPPTLLHVESALIVFEYSHGDEFFPFVLCSSVSLPLLVVIGLDILGEQRKASLTAHLYTHLEVSSPLPAPRAAGSPKAGYPSLLCWHMQGDPSKWMFVLFRM